MLVLEGRVRTRVPTSPCVSTRVPARTTHRTPVPSAHVPTRVPEAPHLATRVPAPPHVPTRRPPTQTRLMATSGGEVTATAEIYAHLGLEYAEQSIQVDKVAAIAVGVPAASTGEVTATATMRARYRVQAESSAEVSASGTARARHTLEAVQTIEAVTDGGPARARYNLEAIQDVAVDNVVDVRPRLALEAIQDAAVTACASTVASVGTVDADVTQAIEVDATADLRVRYPLEATQAIAVDQVATRDAIRVPLEATQSIAVDQTAAPRARYRLDAAQAVVAAPTAKLTPVIGAVSSSVVDATALARARHTIEAVTSAVASASADVEIRSVAFDQVASNTATNNPASVTMTTPACTLIIAVTNNIPGSATTTVDGNAPTLLGAAGNLRLFRADVAAGTHTITTTAGGSWRTLAVAAYTGVASVSGFAASSGTSATPSVTPTGTGLVAVGAFIGPNVSAAGTTSNGNIRAKQPAASSAYNLALADRAAAAPVSLTQTSAAWNAAGVWLS